MNGDTRKRIHVLTEGVNGFEEQSGQCIISSEDIKKEKICDYDSAPTYMKSNPDILHGYRVNFSPGDCLWSLFTWTNETMNIWTHLFGSGLFLGLLIYDYFVRFPDIQPSLLDCLVLLVIVLCFETTLVLSVVYHTFGCQSEACYYKFLSWDIAGVALAFTAIFLSGIHYAFDCHPYWKIFYMLIVSLLTAAVLFTSVVGCGLAKYDRLRVYLFVAWATFGVIPTLHWGLLEGPLHSPLISAMTPRIAAMYGLACCGFLFYLGRFPEKLFPGKVDLVGSSHQIWHLLVIAAMYWWHETGVMFVRMRMDYPCSYVPPQL